MRNYLFICIFILAINLLSNEVKFVDVKELSDSSLEITYKLDKVSYVKSYGLKNPSRIVLEIENSTVKSLETRPFNFPIKQIRAAQNNKLTKLVIDLYEYVDWEKPTQVKTSDGILLKLILKRNKKNQKNTRDIVVAIDAGHGGRDPGAVGSNNVLEKDITLLIAKELERTLRDVSGYSPKMIRAGDELIDLNERYLATRRIGADIFISIHADGFRLSSVKGASVYIWSAKASSISAENLSKKALASKIGKIADNDFDEDEARVNFPDIYEKKISDSKKLGNEILSELRNDPYTKLHKKNIEYADFRVLKSFDTPSVLIESGFMTNPDDAERLKGKPGRRMIARSIFLGLHNYFKNTPIPDSVFEDNSDYVMYEIQKGDVLSEIAVRFGLSVEVIEVENKLKNKAIYPGQIIKIKI